ncbi:uncharacterized protein LOC135497250 [Lineus longissimus]|uniref:uncharacterized protein LOC135497250 n=1 Tax=Lineus longissimus TaxID=88925 RepID=UPI00315DB91F
MEDNSASSDTSSDFFDFSDSDSGDFDFVFDENGSHGDEELNRPDDEIVGIAPYMYEPEPLPDDVVERDQPLPMAIPMEVGEHVEELDYTVLENWCTCDNCQVQHTRAKCVCCRDINEYRAKLTEDENAPTCITAQKGFNSVCINEDVLETAWYQYRQQYGKNAHSNGPRHRRLRHIAYRQLVRWCYGYLGKDIRVVLPSCAVSKIRAFFPPPGLEENFQFVGFQDAIDIE